MDRRGGPPRLPVRRAGSTRPGFRPGGHRSPVREIGPGCGTSASTSTLPSSATRETRLPANSVTNNPAVVGRRVRGFASPEASTSSPPPRRRSTRPAYDSQTTSPVSVHTRPWTPSSPAQASCAAPPGRSARSPSRSRSRTGSRRGNRKAADEDSRIEYEPGPAGRRVELEDSLAGSDEEPAVRRPARSRGAGTRATRRRRACSGSDGRSGWPAQSATSSVPPASSSTANGCRRRGRAARTLTDPRTACASRP